MKLSNSQCEPAQINELGARWFTAGNDRYRELTQPYNEAAAAGRPLVLVTPTSTAQVVEAIKWCREAGMRMSVHATGHDFEGRSLAGEVVLSMVCMSGVSYDPETELVTVGGGARVRDLNRALWPRGRAVSTGTSQDVGMAGLAFGGGAAHTSRRYGLTCDALVAAELCSFNGDVLQVDDESDPELMRLLRGSGGGWFGVATRLAFKTYRIRPVTRFWACFDEATGRELLPDLEQLMITAPSDLSMRIGMRISRSALDQTSLASEPVTVDISGQLLGANTSLLRSHFSALRKASTWREETTAYPIAMAGGSNGTGGAFKTKSRFAECAMTKPGLDEFVDHLHEHPGTKHPDGAGICLFAWGGAIKNFPATKSCAQGRNAQYLASYDTTWMPGQSPTEVETQLSWIRQLDAIAGRRLSEQAYINFPDTDDDRFAERHLKPFLADLKKMIAIHDPSFIGSGTRDLSGDQPTEASISSNA